MATHLPNVETDLATALAGAGLGLTLNTSVFAGPEIPHGDGVNALAVFVIMYTGEALALDPDDVESKPRCQIVIRGEQRDYAGGSSLAIAIMNWIHLRRTVAATGIPSTQAQVYADVRCLDAVPQVLGDNDNQAPRFIVNVEAWYVS